MIRESQVRDKLEALVRNDISLEVFEDWLAQASWSMHNDSAAQAVDLVSLIHVLLSERDDHVLSNADLRRELEHLLNPARALSVQIIISLGPAEQNAAAVHRSTSVTLPIELPEIQIPLGAT